MRHVFASLFFVFGENVNNGWLNHSEQVFIMTSFLYFITFNNGYNGTFRITTVTHECMLKFTYHQIMFPPGCHYTRILCTGMFRLLAQPGRWFWNPTKEKSFIETRHCCPAESRQVGPSLSLTDGELHILNWKVGGDYTDSSSPDHGFAEALLALSLEVMSVLPGAF